MNPYLFDRTWTLFLDRDGVICRKLDGDYVKRWGEFHFLPGALEAIAGLSEIFGRIIIVTNQQGIGKKLMTHEDLAGIHSRMLTEISLAGGRIDKIYYCPSLQADDDPDRKPGTGMALKAQADFPEIDFMKSVMVGDSEIDTQFGNRLGMITVLVGTAEARPVTKHDRPESTPKLSIESLQDFRNWVAES